MSISQRPFPSFRFVLSTQRDFADEQLQAFTPSVALPSSGAPRDIVKRIMFRSREGHEYECILLMPGIYTEESEALSEGRDDKREVVACVDPEDGKGYGELHWSKPRVVLSKLWNRILERKLLSRKIAK